MNKVKSIGGDIKAGWEKMDKAKRIRLGVIVGAITIVVLLFAYLTQRTEYTVLFSELDEADAGTIVEDLEAKGMDYQLEANGTTILIDEEYIDNYRIDLAMNGLMPSSSTGFEIFDSASMMATDDDREIMYQRAVSGELERAISSLDTVKSAKVLLSIPEASIFQNPEYQQEASASVVLEMRGSQAPSSQTIQGIASLVSGAVEHLPASNIQIVDTKGNLLSASLANGSMNATDVVTQHQQIKQSVERDLEQKVLSLLGPVYGLDKVQVSVNAVMNFDAVEEESIVHTQGENQPVLRSETIHASGSGEFVQSAQGGTLDSNSTVEFGDGEESENNTYDRTSNYEVNSVTTRVIEAPGAIEDLTASIVVLGNPINEDQMMEVVYTAIGADHVSVAFMPETENETPSLIGGEDFMERLKAALADYGLYFVGGLVLFVLLILLMRTVRKRSGREEYEDFDIDEEATEEKVELSEAVREVERKMNESKVANEKEDIVRKQAKDNPELAAEMIKIWMKEK